MGGDRGEGEEKGTRVNAEMTLILNTFCRFVVSRLVDISASLDQHPNFHFVGITRRFKGIHQAHRLHRRPSEAVLPPRGLLSKR